MYWHQCRGIAYHFAYIFSTSSYNIYICCHSYDICTYQQQKIDFTYYLEYIENHIFSHVFCKRLGNPKIYVFTLNLHIHTQMIYQNGEVLPILSKITGSTIFSIHLPLSRQKDMNRILRRGRKRFSELNTNRQPSLSVSRMEVYQVFIASKGRGIDGVRNRRKQCSGNQQ